MNAFEKAKAIVEREMKLHKGHPPRDVTLTLYSDAQAFEFFRPGEDFLSHQKQRAELVAWLQLRGIKTVDIPVTADFQIDADQRAKKAMEASPLNFQKGDPYRLGISLGKKPSEGTSSIGWWMVGLGSSKGGTE